MDTNIPIVDIIKFAKKYVNDIPIIKYHPIASIKYDFITICINRFICTINDRSYDTNIALKLIESLNKPNDLIISISDLKQYKFIHIDFDFLHWKHVYGGTEGIDWKIIYNNKIIITEADAMQKNECYISMNRLRCINKKYTTILNGFRLLEVIEAMYAGIEILVSEINIKIANIDRENALNAFSNNNHDLSDTDDERAELSDYLIIDSI
jgi:hypothetical protein